MPRRSTIQALTGLQVDHYMQVNLLGFYRISEAIGGVQVCLNAAQNKHHRDRRHGSGYSGIDLPKGVSIIKGAQALAFVRQRHGLPHGDLDRIKRQQYFLKAAFNKITIGRRAAQPVQAARPARRGRLVAADRSRPRPALAGAAVPVRRRRARSPSRRSRTTARKLIYPDGVETSIVEVNQAALPAFVDQLAGQERRRADARPAGGRAATVTVDVLNGTDTRRAGRPQRRRRSQALGFRINTVDSTATRRRARPSSTRPGRRPQAKAVLAAVPGAKAVPTPDVARVTVVLGTNGVMVKGVRRRPRHRRRPRTAARGDAPALEGRRARPAATGGLGCID